MFSPFSHPSCLVCSSLIAAGRTTFVNTLCGKRVLNHKDSDDPTVAHIEDGVKIKPITVGTSSSAAAPMPADADCAQSSMKKAPASPSQ